MQSTRLTLICHDATRAQKRGQWPLDEALQVPPTPLRLAGRFKKAPRLLCGPERRTRQTAMLFGEDARVDDGLRDMDVGRWHGQDVNAIDHEEMATWLADSTRAPHGGESVVQLCERVGQWMQALQDQPGHVLAVTHPSVIRAALLHVMQCPVGLFYLIDVEPLSSTDLRFNRVWRLRLDGHRE
ncbi:putative phosphoglycerate mutase [Pseudomonas fluorescens]|uniref:Putative phosphoglycerate mutase n=1 Tax=Pseudomonas fluorescens TaxID=294 RepID=A0A379IDJ4_PSEFL|nr:histidine phosphatase family protein [Pseudomonas fluorescens]AIG00707.1 phosphoglycerate mutase [Pseudomonas fluorescens]SUD30373.1 putative phosphoglycerate mutase [Pseudomonas fluorescens]